jgi:hypothetical protein
VGTTQGMSISTYTGTGSAATIGHGLGSTPEFIIVFKRTAENHATYHKDNTAAPATDALYLSNNEATADDASFWNDTAPTSTVWSTGGGGNTGGSGATYVAYCWVGVEGYSKFGGYEGNGSTDGTFVWCGFRPAWVMAKSIDSTSDWYIYTSKIPGYNAFGGNLYGNTTSEDIATANTADFLSNGFKWRVTSDPNTAETWVFAAFAEFPFGGSGVAQARAR